MRKVFATTTFGPLMVAILVALAQQEGCNIEKLTPGPKVESAWLILAYESSAQPEWVSRTITSGFADAIAARNVKFRPYDADQEYARKLLTLTNAKLPAAFVVNADGGKLLKWETCGPDYSSERLSDLVKSGAGL